MTAFSSIDLSQIAAPQIIEALDYETILAAMLADLQARDTVFDALVESDPAYKILEVCAYREMLIRQRVNEGAQAVMLAYATGTDLDNIGATFGVQRLTITPANPTTIPPTPAVLETDTAYRARIQLSFEAYTTAGSTGSYVFYSLSADPTVKDVAVLSNNPGEVDVYVLSTVGDGTAGSSLISTVEAALSPQTVRPLTDKVNVYSASIIYYSITAQLVMQGGPDASVIQASALAAIQAYVLSVQRVGYTVALSGIYAALQQAGVTQVNLTSPTASVVPVGTQAAYCTAINLSVLITS